MIAFLAMQVCPLPLEFQCLCSISCLRAYIELHIIIFL
uniref:Uncharacterized protein n=1 Tax=Anguilla anguilla TaxID=7936 RepID=A0A0E9W2D9_ANGAN